MHFSFYFSISSSFHPICPDFLLLLFLFSAMQRCLPAFVASGEVTAFGGQQQRSINLVFLILDAGPPFVSLLHYSSSFLNELVTVKHGSTQGQRIFQMGCCVKLFSGAEHRISENQSFQKVVYLLFVKILYFLAICIQYLGSASVDWRQISNMPLREAESLRGKNGQRFSNLQKKCISNCGAISSSM